MKMRYCKTKGKDILSRVFNVGADFSCFDMNNPLPSIFKLNQTHVDTLLVRCGFR